MIEEEEEVRSGTEEIERSKGEDETHSFCISVDSFHCEDEGKENKGVQRRRSRTTTTGEKEAARTLAFARHTLHVRRVSSFAPKSDDHKDEVVDQYEEVKGRWGRGNDSLQSRRCSSRRPSSGKTQTLREMRGVADTRDL